MPDQPNEFEETLASLRAIADQAIAASSELAKMVHNYYSELVEQGFNADQALALSLAYQTVCLQSGGSE